MNCSKCGALHAAIANTGRGEGFDSAFYALEKAGSAFRRCPACRTYFHWVDRPQLYGSGNLDEEEYQRLSPQVSALLDRLLPPDPNDPGDPGPIAAYFEQLPLELLIEALDVNVFRWKVMQPFIPELARRFVESGDTTYYGLLLNYRYQSSERAHELLRALDAGGENPHGHHFVDVLRGECEDTFYTSTMP